jgi:hypothetical protein
MKVITDYKLQRNYQISIRISCLHSDHHISNVLAAIAFIALDTRLGCLDSNLEPDSEPQKMIDSVQTQFDCLHKMEAKFPVWKYLSTATWRRYVKASDVFVEYV